MKQPSRLLPLILVICFVGAVLGVGLKSEKTENRNAIKVKQDKVKINKSRDEEEFTKNGPEGPAGQWSVAAAPDLFQYHSPDAPAIILSAKSHIGNGKWRNLVVAGVAIKNRASQSISTLTLKWILTPLEDKSTVLLDGLTPEFQANILLENQNLKNRPSLISLEL